MTFQAKLSCMLNVSGATQTTLGVMEPEAQESYVNTFNFLTDMAKSGSAERIAYYIGHPNSGALGNGDDFWWTADACGGNAWSVWRFPSSSLRTFDYYLLIQHAGGTVTNFLLGNISQSYAYVDTVQSYPNTYRGMFAYQLAASYDSATGIASNPWNGTTNNDGTDSKGTPTWVTGSPGHELLVLPAGNINRPNKDQVAAIYYRGNVGTVYGRNFSIFNWANTDNDGLAFAYYDTTTNNPPTIANTDYYTYVSYIGTYNVRPELSGSFICPLIGVGGEVGTAAQTAIFREDATQISLSGSSGIAGSGSNVYRTYTLARTGIWSIDGLDYNGPLRNSIINPGRATYEMEPIWLLATGALGYYCGMVGYMSKYFGHINAEFPETARAENMIFSSPDPTPNGGLYFPWTGSVAWPYGTSISGSTFVGTKSPIEGAYLQFDPDLLTFTSGASISSWLNQGSANVTASQSTANSQPRFGRDYVGKFVECYNTQSLNLGVLPTVLTRDWTFVAVYKRNVTTGGDRRIIDINTGRLIFGSAGTTGTTEAVFDGAYREHGPAVSTDPIAMIVTANSASAEINAYQTGSLTSASPQGYTSRAIAASNAYLFSNPTGTANFFVGKIYYLALYPFVFTDEQRTEMYKYLRGRFPSIYI